MKSIIQYDKTYCYLCLRDGKMKRAVHEHHIFGAANRKYSEKYGLKVQLCLECHTAGPNAVHNNKEVMDRLHRYGQEAFERNHTRQQFMDIFGRNYL